MPLQLDVALPLGATLGPGTPLEDRIAAIPGFLGLWRADRNVTFAAETRAVSAWGAARGGGTFVQATAARQPLLSAPGSGALQILTNGARQLALDTPPGTVTAFTVAVTLEQGEVGIDNQILFGNDLSSPLWRVTRRTGAGAPSYRLDSGADTDAPDSPLAGKRVVIATQGAGTSRVRVNAGAWAAAANAAALLDQFVIGNSRAAATATGLQGGLRAVSLFAADLAQAPDDLAVVQGWHDLV